MLRPRLVVPTHYDTFKVIAQDPTAFARGLEEQGTRCEVLAPWQELQL